ncbi:MAG: MFS transporter [Candidatus Sumerlaeota bacterium]|nr:MFS transporter [Candidatus Sumerlaeota bacterium]
MRRKYIYYLLTAAMSCAYMGGILNTQFIIVMKGQPWSPVFGWELIVAGWGALLYALGSLFLAPLSDRFGRLPCIAAACAIMMAFQSIMGWHLLGQYRIWHFFLYWGVECLFFALFFTGVEGLMSDYQDHRMPLARRLGLYCLSWAAGDTVGAFVTGYVKEAFGAEAMFRGFAVVMLVALGVIGVDWLRHGHRRFGERPVEVEDIHPEASFHARLGRIGIFFGCIAFSAVTAAFPRFGRDFHGLTEGVIGNILSVNLFICAFTFIWFPFWKRWQYNAELQIILQLAMVAGLLMLFVAPRGGVYLLRAAFMLFGFGWSASYFFSIYYSLQVPAGHARSGGFHEAVLGLGSLVGPVMAVGGMWAVGKARLLTGARIGVVAVIVAIAAVVFSIILQAILRKTKRRSSPVKCHAGRVFY